MCGKRTRGQPPVARTCEECAAEFMAFASTVRIGSGRFCSNRCRGLARSFRARRECQECGGTFALLSKQKAQRFCSPTCSVEASRKLSTPEMRRAAVICRSMLRRLVLAARFEKRGRTESELGYSFQQLKAHLEERFEPWMSWANHGDWHVDHIVPVSWFVAHGISDPKIINALSNLRPLEKKANLSKGDRLVSRSAQMAA